jgi:MFS transporter, UMF1 family
MFSRQALNPGVKGREVFAWAMYDFANSGYTTVVLTAVFSAYFVGVAAQGKDWAALAWTVTLAISYAIVMLIMPVLGQFADRAANKKTILAWSTVGCVVSTAALALVGTGDIWLAVVLVIVSNVCFSVGESMTASFLPEIAKPESMGKVSGWGWSFGYFGGMLALALSLAYVISAKKGGATATQFVPVTMLITAVIFAIAALPTFFLLRERAVAKPQPLTVQPSGFSALAATWRDVQRFVDFKGLLICAVFYQAGIAVVIALAAIYAEQTMKFTQEDTMALIFVVNVASVFGAFGFGYFQDRIGHRNALAVTLLGWIAMVVLAYLSVTRDMFWVAATIAGLCMGSSQSCGRALAAYFAPPGRVAEFFGLWTFATRLASIIGPITYGLVAWISGGNHRLAMLGTGIFFVIGLLLLRRVDVARGRALAIA